jgi:hypothetical protein
MATEQREQNRNALMPGHAGVEPELIAEDAARDTHRLATTERFALFLDVYPPMVSRRPSFFWTSRAAGSGEQIFGVN